MSRSTFTFVEKFSKDLAELAYRIEEQLFEQPNAALVQARLYSEELVKMISANEELEDVYPLKHSERIHKLHRENAIDEDLYMKLELIRKKGNKAAHDVKEADILDVIQVHKYLFELSEWYMQVYVSFDFEAPMYNLPLKTDKNSTSFPQKELEDLMKPYLDQTLQKFDEMRREVHEQLESLKEEREGVQPEVPTLTSKQNKPEATVNEDHDQIDHIFKKNQFDKKGETKKASEYEHKQTKETIYLLRYKEITIALNPDIINESLKCEKRIRHNTALKNFPKKINKGKVATSYGYFYTFKNEGELDDFLKIKS